MATGTDHKFWWNYHLCRTKSGLLFQNRIPSLVILRISNLEGKNSSTMMSGLLEGRNLVSGNCTGHFTARRCDVVHSCRGQVCLRAYPMSHVWALLHVWPHSFVNLRVKVCGLIVSHGRPRFIANTCPLNCVHSGVIWLTLSWCFLAKQTTVIFPAPLPR